MAEQVEGEGATPEMEERGDRMPSLVLQPGQDGQLRVFNQATGVTTLAATTPKITFPEGRAPQPRKNLSPSILKRFAARGRK